VRNEAFPVKTHTHGTRQWALQSLPSSLPKTALPAAFAPGLPAALSSPAQPVHTARRRAPPGSGALRRGCCAALGAQEEPWAGRVRQRVALGGSRGHAREALAQKCYLHFLSPITPRFSGCASSRGTMGRSS